MSLYLVVKFLHELAAFWFVAGIIGRQLVRHLARRSDNIHNFATLTQVAGRFESLMVIPGNFLVIVLGVIVALMGDWPIFGFIQGAGQNWLMVTNLILLAGFFVVPLIYLPRGKLFDRALAEAITAGQMTPELNTILDDPVVRWAHRGEYIGLAIILFLMVTKPF